MVKPGEGEALDRGSPQGNAGPFLICTEPKQTWTALCCRKASQSSGMESRRWDSQRRPALLLWALGTADFPGSTLLSVAFQSPFNSSAVFGSPQGVSGVISTFCPPHPCTSHHPSLLGLLPARPLPVAPSLSPPTAPVTADNGSGSGSAGASPPRSPGCRRSSTHMSVPTAPPPDPAEAAGNVWRSPPSALALGFSAGLSPGTQQERRHVDHLAC